MCVSLSTLGAGMEAKRPAGGLSVPPTGTSVALGREGPAGWPALPQTPAPRPCGTPCGPARLEWA